MQATCLGFAEVLAQLDLTYLAPEATGRSWYPYSFLAPIARNEPFLSSALELIDRLLDGVSSEGLESPRSPQPRSSCYISNSYCRRSPTAMASALIAASSAPFAETTATSQPVSGLERTLTVCPSSARPSLIISTNSSAAIFVLRCMVQFSTPSRAGKRFTNPAVAITGVGPLMA